MVLLLTPSTNGKAVQKNGESKKQQPVVNKHVVKSNIHIKIEDNSENKKQVDSQTSGTGEALSKTQGKTKDEEKKKEENGAREFRCKFSMPLLF